MSFGGGSGSSSISGSTDVVLSSPANNDVLGYNSGLAKWQNQNLSSTYGRIGSAFADISNASGVDPTGATECHAALQTALNACASAGQRAYLKGIFSTTGTLTITGSVDMTDAMISYTGTGTAVVVGATGSELAYKQIRLPWVFSNSKTIAGWSQVAGSIGVQIINAWSCDFYIPHITYFETGLNFYATADHGNCYNTVTLGELENNKVNLLLSCVSTGWTNQNTFVGGQLSHAPAEGAGCAGARHIQMTGATWLPGNNTFIGTSLEGIYQEYTMNIDGGEDNVFLNCRFEGPSTVRWGATASRNWIVGQSGTQTDSALAIVQTRVTGAINNVVSSGRDLAGIAGRAPILTPISGAVAIEGREGPLHAFRGFWRPKMGHTPTYRRSRNRSRYRFRLIHTSLLRKC